MAEEDLPDTAADDAPAREEGAAGPSRLGRAGRWAAGILVGRNNMPLVNEGEALYHIARFEEVSEVAQSLEVFTNDIEEGPTLSGEPPIV